MAFMKTKQYESTPNFLASEVGLVLKTCTANQADAETIDDKKIIKAGTFYPKDAKTTNDFCGIVFEDVDMTDDETRPISVVYSGHVLYYRLPEELSETEKNILLMHGVYLHYEENPEF